MESMPESITIRLPNAKSTTSAGASLAETLYTSPLTISLTGELGVGKTTFLQGFARKLGVKEHLTSPTYALEQRYQTENSGELLHIDLFRLGEDQAKEVIASSDDHPGIRCIEWGDRLPEETLQPHITIAMTEDPQRIRTLKATFCDIPLPSQKEIEGWRNEVHLPQHISQHCDAVADFAVRCAIHLQEQGIIVRTEALRKAAQLHDILRFVEFNAENDAIWEELVTSYKGLPHEAAGANFLRDKGFPEISRIVHTHGLNIPNPPDMTTEQKLLFYADKRVKFTEVVSLDERFEDFVKRYEGTGKEDYAQKWLEEAKEMERELFNDNAP